MRNLIAAFCVVGIALADITPSCEEYFSKALKAIEISQNKEKLDSAKKIFNEQKEKFKTMPAQTQNGICEPALKGLNEALDKLKNNR